jgi:hypothetical protein
MIMTLDQFRASGSDCADIGKAVDDVALEGTSGRVYLGALYIERWDDARDGIAPPHGKPTWLLTLENNQYDGDILELEARLFLWAIDSGYDIAAAAPARTYRTEFPDFPAPVPALLTGKGWTDSSWHNDAMPFFIHEASGVGVWCNYVASDLPEAPLFMVVGMGHSVHGWQHEGTVDLFETDDAGVLATSLPHFTTVRAIAHAFATTIETDYACYIDDIRRLNASPEYVGSCATHDFLDANMPMADAFEAIVGHFPVGDDDATPQHADDVAIWNAAWDIARKERLTGDAPEAAAAVAVGTVLDLFEATFPGVTLADDTLTAALRSMPVDSTCGDDCKAAILSGGLLAVAVIKAHGRDYGAETITAIAGIAASSCGTYICG